MGGAGQEFPCRGCPGGMSVRIAHARHLFRLDDLECPCLVADNSEGSSTRELMKGERVETLPQSPRLHRIVCTRKSTHPDSTIIMRSVPFQRPRNNVVSTDIDIADVYYRTPCIPNRSLVVLLRSK
jgi:hypothetical protein